MVAMLNDKFNRAVLKVVIQSICTAKRKFHNIFYGNLKDRFTSSIKMENYFFDSKNIFLTKLKILQRMNFTRHSTGR